MEPFAFHAELFEVRSVVLELLADHGFEWFSDFGSIDLLHDVYGIEVCEIRHEADARTIETLLLDEFCTWTNSHVYYDDDGSRDRGWKVVISRDREDYEDHWDRVT